MQHANVLTKPGPLCHLNKDHERERLGLLEPGTVQGFTSHLSDHLLNPQGVLCEGLSNLLLPSSQGHTNNGGEGHSLYP